MGAMKTPEGISPEGALIYGCETCHRLGQVVVGWTEPLMFSPSEPVWEECPVCLGHGEVKEWELEEWDGVFPSEEEVVDEMMRKRRRD